MAQQCVQQRSPHARRGNDLLCGERFWIQSGCEEEAACHWYAQKDAQTVRTATRRQPGVAGKQTIGERLLS